MDVRIEVTVRVDPRAWADEYHIESDAVRDDVQNYCFTQLSESYAAQAKLITQVL